MRRFYVSLSRNRHKKFMSVNVLTNVNQCLYKGDLIWHKLKEV